MNSLNEKHSKLSRRLLFVALLCGLGEAARDNRWLKLVLAQAEYVNQNIETAFKISKKHQQVNADQVIEYKLSIPQYDEIKEILKKMPSEVLGDTPAYVRLIPEASIHAMNCMLKEENVGWGLTEKQKLHLTQNEKDYKISYVCYKISDNQLTFIEKYFSESKRESRRKKLAERLLKQYSDDNDTVTVSIPKKYKSAINSTLRFATLPKLPRPVCSAGSGLGPSGKILDYKVTQAQENVIRHYIAAHTAGQKSRMCVTDSCAYYDSHSAAVDALERAESKKPFKL